MAELAELMKKNPVKIFVRWDRTCLEYPYDWQEKNPEAFGRISDLVYQDPAVFHHINRLPAGLYTGRNLANL